MSRWTPSSQPHSSSAPWRLSSASCSTARSGSTPSAQHLVTEKCSCSQRSGTLLALRPRRGRQPRVTGKRQPAGWWLRLLGASLAVLTVTGCCSEGIQPQPVVIKREFPPLLPDRRDELLARQNDLTRWLYLPDRINPETVTIPHEDLRLLIRCMRDGWANVRALERAGWGK